MPAKGHVGLTFMIQFIAIMLGFGIGMSALKERGFGTPLIILLGLVFLVVLHLVIGVLVRLIPARCTGCRNRSARFQGFGWWPFIYRYHCAGCGHDMKLEIQG